MEIILTPVATITNKRTTPTDDFWGDTISEITLLPHIPEDAFKEIEEFSHLEIIYFFDQAEDSKIVFSGRPRGNPAWPEMGIFCQRKKDRPNHLGLCTVELVGHSGRSIKVKYLDAIDGSPVLDIKPVFKEFGLKSEIKQPAWTVELMKDYWK
jgi:tRNA-Thr(GGU) m(6)t(6)A37 methyltransferase TsaA